jgi:hypothetical protein
MARSAPRPRRNLEHRRALLIGLALLCCYAYFYYLGGSWNVKSRYSQVLALAENHTLAIDEFAAEHGDQAYYRGHYYSDKLLGPSLVAVPVYLAARPVVSLVAGGPARTRLYALPVVNFITDAIPSALLGALLYLFLANLGLAPALRVWLTVAYGLGTLALPYSTALFGHQLAAVCVAGAFMLLWRQKRDLSAGREGEWRAPRAAAAGALLGLGAICDFTTLFLALFIGLYALWVASGRGSGAPVGAGTLVRRAAPFVLVALIPVAIQLGANWSSFGGPLSFPHLHHTEASFRARHTHGLLGVHLPQLFPLYQLTFGSWRGLFYGSPVLLLALPGFFLLGKRWRAEAIIIAVAWLGLLLMSAGYQNWTSGSIYGPRYQIAAIPLLILAVAAAAAKWPAVLKGLTVVSAAFMLIVTAHTPLIAESVRDPLSVALGGFARGELLQPNLGMLLGLPGLASLLPLIVIVAALLFAVSRLREEAPRPAARPRKAKRGLSPDSPRSGRVAGR